MPQNCTSVLEKWECQGRNGNITPHLGTIVPPTLFPPEPQVFILNGSSLTLAQRLISWQLLNQIYAALQTFNTHLTNSPLCSYSGNSYNAWMKLKALWAQAHFTVVFMTDDRRQRPREPDTGSADKGSGWIMELLWHSAPNKARRALEWRIRYISFPGLRNTQTHIQMACPMCVHVLKIDGRSKTKEKLSRWM